MHRQLVSRRVQAAWWGRGGNEPLAAGWTCQVVERQTISPPKPYTIHSVVLVPPATPNANCHVIHANTAPVQARAAYRRHNLVTVSWHCHRIVALTDCAREACILQNA